MTFPFVPSRQRGVSLLELMVALALGALLILGLAQLFSASKASFLTTQGLSRVQEASRFSIDFLQRDIRMAGLLGCGNDLSREQIRVSSGIRGVFTHFATDGNAENLAAAPPLLRYDMPLQGWEASGTDDGSTIDRSASEALPLAGAATDWTPALPGPIWAAMSNIAIRGSDVVAVRISSFDGVPARLNKTSPATVQLFNPSARPMGMLTEQGIYMLSDCKKSSFLHVTGPVNGAGIAPVAMPGGLNTAGFTATEGEYSGGSMLYRMNSYVYFVGLADHDADGTRESPALFRLNIQLTSAGALGVVAEELVDGVENMQLRYNFDGNAITATPNPDGIPERVGSADTVSTAGASLESGWRGVGSVQVGLLIRAQDRAVANARNSSALCSGATVLGGAYCVNGVRYIANNDERMRQSYDTTITLRNRLNGN